MGNVIIMQSVGFVTCFILLFYFIAKYRAALLVDTDEEYGLDDLTVMTIAKPVPVAREAAIEMAQRMPALEVADLKEQLKELHYHLEEYKLAQQKNNAEWQKQMARMEQRLSIFEKEYVTKLQPTLLSLIKELESMKVAEGAGKDPTQESAKK